MKKLSLCYSFAVTAILLSCSQKTNISSASDSKSTLLTVVMITCLIMAGTFLLSSILRRINKKK